MNSLNTEAFEQFMANDDGGPVVMLNLLRFHPDGGRERYHEYLGKAGPILARLGAEIVFAGDGLPALAAGDGQAWDATALVRYPNRQAFVSLVGDPEYHKVDPLRVSALSEAVLQPMRPL